MIHIVLGCNQKLADYLTQALHDFIDEKMTKPPQEILLTTENLGLLTKPEVNLSLGKDIQNTSNGKI